MTCDIIIPVWNQLSFTRNCVDSILKNTDAGYRLIIIDNASDKETRDYLESLKSLSHPPVLLVRNEKNVGFIKAVNKGFELSDAKYVCVLNNDTIVAKDWLNEMISVAESSDAVGIVNPSSNNLGQRPGDGESVDMYSMRIKKDAGKYAELGAAIGFCMLIKRGVIEKIGVFDEVFGMGNFEDTDYSRRACKAGYICVRACGAYVFHRENASFGHLKSFEADFKHNREIYEFRWGKPSRVAYVLDDPDDNIMRRVNAESITLARGGSWIWYFMKDKLEMPIHSNIVGVNLGPGNFSAKAIFRILKKKKKFSHIFVSGGSLGRIFEKLAFIHKAKVSYY